MRNDGDDADEQKYYLFSKSCGSFTDLSLGPDTLQSNVHQVQLSKLLDKENIHLQLLYFCYIVLKDDINCTVNEQVQLVRTDEALNLAGSRSFVYLVLISSKLSLVTSAAST